jgi:hypothetical protein
MAFKALFIAHAPDADPVRHHNLIETGRYKLYTLNLFNFWLHHCLKL